MLNRNEEKIDYSKKVKGEANRYKISIQQKAFADLIALGWKDFDAYLLAGLYNPVYNKQVNMRDMNNLLTEDNDFILYLKMMERRINRAKTLAESAEQEQERQDKEQKNKEEMEGINMSAELSKEHQLLELLVAKNKFDIGSKEWLEVKKMIADITQAKKDEIKEEDNTIHYYLPLTCSMCELYKKYGKKK